MLRKTRTLVLLTAAGALLALPALTGFADTGGEPNDHAKTSRQQGQDAAVEKAPKVGYVVKGHPRQPARPTA